MKERPIYVFEEVDEDLSQLPTAAQRALDHRKFSATEGTEE